MNLEGLIRDAAESGAHIIALKTVNGDFAASVMRPMLDRYVTRRGSDPVAALRSALIEDERQTRDAPRAAAAAADPYQLDMLGTPALDDMEDLLG